MVWSVMSFFLANSTTCTIAYPNEFPFLDSVLNYLWMLPNRSNGGQRNQMIIPLPKFPCRLKTTAAQPLTTPRARHVKLGTRV